MLKFLGKSPPLKKRKKEISFKILKLLEWKIEMRWKWSQYQKGQERKERREKLEKAIQKQMTEVNSNTNNPVNVNEQSIWRGSGYQTELRIFMLLIKT